MSIERYEAVSYVTENKVGHLTLNRPEVLNAMDLRMREEIEAVINEASRDPSVKALIITGAGRAFCAGGDVRTMGHVGPFAGRERLKNVHRWLYQLLSMEKPVIAAVNGVAAGAGLSLAMCCDIIVASEEASFAISFLRVGLVPDCGALYFLPRLVGLHKAKELVFTGARLSAAEAERLGLVNRVVPANDLNAVAREMAERLAEGPTRAMGLAKSILNLSLHSDLATILELEAYAQDLCFQTEDHKEGMRAFVEKRAPVFTGM